MQDIREYAKDRENVGNWRAARAAYAVADLRDAHALITSAWQRLEPNDGWRYRDELARTMARIVTDARAIVFAADLPEEYLL